MHLYVQSDRIFVTVLCTGFYGKLNDDDDGGGGDERYNWLGTNMLGLRVFDDKAGKWQRKQWLDDLAEWLVKTVPEPVRLTEDRVITLNVSFVESPIWFHD